METLLTFALTANLTIAEKVLEPKGLPRGSKSASLVLLAKSFLFTAFVCRLFKLLCVASFAASAAVPVNAPLLRSFELATVFIVLPSAGLSAGLSVGLTLATVSVGHKFDALWAIAVAKGLGLLVDAVA